MNSMQDIIEKLMEIEELKFEKEVADLLGVSNDSLSQYKKRGAIPYSKIVAYCINKKVSFDEIIGLYDDSYKKIIEKNKTVNILMINENISISLPKKHFNSELPESCRAYNTDKNITYIIDTSILEYITKGNYLIEHDDNLKIINIFKDLTNKYNIVEENEEYKLNKEDFTKHITIKGKAINKIIFE